MGQKSAIVNGQRITFDEEQPPTMQELREQGAVTEGQQIIRDLGNGRRENLTKKDVLATDSVINSVPRYIWGR
jgi:hypothetical protein